LRLIDLGLQVGFTIAGVEARVVEVGVVEVGSESD